MSADRSEATPAIDFNTFVLSLSTSALAHLGAVEIPGETVERSVALAQHTIDCLEMLEAKTAGNLTGEEERLLSQVLDDLREKCAAASKG